MNKYLWTAFLFSDPDQKLHCTHKFMGKQTLDVMQQVGDICNDYFKSNPFKGLEVQFDYEDKFGPNKDIKVLRYSIFEDLSDKELKRKTWLLDLREELDIFYKDDFGFNPHITTSEISLLHCKFVRYGLFWGDKCVNSWWAS